MFGIGMSIGVPLMMNSYNILIDCCLKGPLLLAFLKISEKVPHV